LVLQISARLDENVPLFLVGNSLGANLMAKYLGEEGLSGTLPACVAGAVSLGNPMLFHADHIAFPYNVLIGSARKQTYMEHWRTFRKMRDPAFQKSLRKGLYATTLAGLDRALAPTMVRNDAFYPYSSQIGYETGLSYWRDSGSYRLVPFISVPFLHLTAEDDFLVYGSSKNKLGYCVANPNVMVVETRCGGHLGWQESPPDAESIFSLSSSWADVASADFFDAVMQVNTEDSGFPAGSTRALDGDFIDLENLQEDAVRSTKQLRSRL
jgi:predicted alpha/beta-fold hydrolase